MTNRQPLDQGARFQDIGGVAPSPPTPLPRGERGEDLHSAHKGGSRRVAGVGVFAAPSHPVAILILASAVLVCTPDERSPAQAPPRAPLLSKLALRYRRARS